jgi:hypothetical protein
LGRWRAPYGSHVAGERAILDGALEDQAQETVRVADCSRRQPHLGKRGVPSLDMLWLEVLQLELAEVRNDLALGQLPIAL